MHQIDRYLYRIGKTHVERTIRAGRVRRTLWVIGVNKVRSMREGSMNRCSAEIDEERMGVWRSME